MLAQGTFEDLRRTDHYVQTLLKNSNLPASILDEEVVEDNENEEEPKPSHQTTAVEDDDDERRQVGDRTVYRYYFGSIGKPFFVSLLTIEIIWAFLESFPSSSSPSTCP